MNRFPRWLWGTALLALVVAADLLLIREQPAAELVIEMQSSEASQAKVYYDTGAGFNERESATHAIAADTTVHRLKFALPSKAVRSIRFDPLEVTGTVHIHGVVFERPRTHARLGALDTRKITGLNEIVAITPRALELDVTIAENARDPQLLLPVERPLEFHHSVDELFTKRNLRRLAVLLVLAAIVAAAVGARRKVKAPAALTNAFDRWSNRASLSAAFPFDRGALWFYTVCLAAFVLLTAGQFHGSSLSIAGASYLGWTDVSHTPLVGTPKRVRSDEWSFHTPTILNQLYRKDRLSVNDCLLGPGKAAVLGNIPCWHFSQIFRPQFWPFFVLPPGFAFAAYWQAKALLLLTGVFTLVFMLTRSSPIAAMCALWNFFSAYVQWGYSWASLLPEMIGLFSWTIALTCYLMVGRNRTGLILAAIACAACAINFALCAYPPHQVPLALFGAALVAGWFWHHRSAIRTGPQPAARFLCLTGCWVLVGAVMMCIYFDAKETILAAANTVYPGQRSSSGGGIPPAQFLSHFLDFWKSEENYPAAQGNICEASGYLWLAPFTLLIRRPAKELRLPSAILLLSWIAVFVLLAWMLFPIPAAVGKWLGLDRVPPFRSFHALGLINITIVAIFLVEQLRAQQMPQLVRRFWLRGLAAAALLTWLLVRMNRTLDHFFPTYAIWIASIYAAALVLLLLQARVRLFGFSVILPLALANGLINPIDRGLEMLTRTALFQAVHKTHPDWRDGKWIIFAPWAAEPGVLAATGLDVVSCLKVIPDRQNLALFDPDGRYADVINRSSYFFALPLRAHEPSTFESPSSGNVLWRVSPIDPRLRSIGVTRSAAAYQPLAREIAAEVAPFQETSLPGLQIYRTP